MPRTRYVLDEILEEDLSSVGARTEPWNKALGRDVSLLVSICRRDSRSEEPWPTDSFRFCPCIVTYEYESKGGNANKTQHKTKEGVWVCDVD